MVTILITLFREHITLLLSTHEPPGRALRFGFPTACGFGLRVSGFGFGVWGLGFPV